MRGARILGTLAGLAAAVAVSGCNLGSRTIVATFEGPEAMNVAGTLVGSTAIGRADVDLGTVAEYRNFRSELRGIVDVALLGAVKNNGVTFIGAEFYVTADSTNLANANQVRSQAKRLWGPVTLNPGQRVQLDWNQSVQMIDRNGRAVIEQEARGDGKFTIYAIGLNTGTSYNFTIEDFNVVLVLDSDS